MLNSIRRAYVLRPCLSSTNSISLRKGSTSNFNKQSEEKPKDGKSEKKFGRLAFEKNDRRVSPTLKTLINRGVEEERLADFDEQEYHEAKIADTSRPKPVDFLKKINHLIYREGNLKEALRLYEVEMKKERVLPKEKHFRVLIHGCGKVGYHSKAFELWADLKKRPNLDADNNRGIYADLFNSCANTPQKYKHLAERRTNSLRKWLREKNLPLNDVVYHNMIKALGKVGSFTAAFSVVDEMREIGIPVGAETLTHLLNACISDRKNGFRHALLTWRKMLDLNAKTRKHKRSFITPDTEMINNMLTCAKLCSIGDETFIQDVLLASMSVEDAQTHLKRLEESRSVRKLKDGSLNNEEPQSLQPLRQSINDEPPNLLAERPNFANIVQLNSITNPNDRFALMGGIQGLKTVMKEYKIQPDVRTISIAMNLMAIDHQSVSELIEVMTEFEVTPNIDFFNQLIKRRAFTYDFDGGFELVKWIAAHGLEPDVMTFGVLALCANTSDRMRTLVKDLHERGYRMNVEIIGALLNGAVHRKFPQDVVWLLKMMKSEDVAPSELIVRKLVAFDDMFRAAILDYENGKTNEKTAPAFIRQQIKNDWKRWKAFTVYYQEWLRETEMEKAIKDPWSQYGKPDDDNQSK